MVVRVIQPFEVFSPLPPVVESGHVNLDVVSKTLPDYQLVANDAAGLVNKGSRLRLEGIVEGRLLKRHEHAAEVILSVHGASHLVSGFQTGRLRRSPQRRTRSERTRREDRSGA